MMYCKKCGKIIETGDYCADCAALQPTSVSLAQGKLTRNIGGAIAAAVLGVVGFAFSVVAYFFAYFMLVQDLAFVAEGFGWGDGMLSLMPSFSVIFGVIATALAVVGLILGIRSIRTFKAACASGARKPIPTLVVGIVGVVYAALALLYVMLSLFMLVIAMLLLWV